MGVSEVQMFQMNQSHNDDVMDMNGQCTDRLNEQVTDDDVTNVNRLSTDDLVDESHKMKWWKQLQSTLRSFFIL